MHRTLLTIVSLLLALAAPLRATWSIIIIDTRTGEIAIGSATCVSGNDLRVLTPVIVVGKGVGVAQSFVDSSGQNRITIFNEIGKGTPLARILAMLAQADPGHQTRQYGMADVSGDKLTFTGTQAGAWAGGLVGSAGSLVWAIQGNVITGQPVVTAAEAAIKSTEGGLADKLMMAMEAARLMGGDGRCSCLSGPPPSCGAPPPSFVKTAHIGFMIVARQGDVDGGCNGARGCAQGTYYMNLNVPNKFSRDPDPVFTLAQMFATWSKQQVGRPDHHHSEVVPDRAVLPADGKTATLVRVQLRDRFGDALAAGGAKLAVTLDPRSRGGLTIGAVRDLGAGRYEFPVTAGTVVGEALLRVEVDDGKGDKRLLSPRTRIDISADPLWVSRTEVSLTGGGRLDFVLNPGVASARRAFVLLASNSGSKPGIRLGTNLVLPLNPDPLFNLTVNAAASGKVPNLLGVLDAGGRATTYLDLPPGLFGLMLGTDITLAYGQLAPIDAVSNAVDVEIVR